MCIKIICSDHEHEFDMAMPLEQQIVGANEIVVSYDPADPKIPSFIGQMEMMVKNGISCRPEIHVDVKDSLDGCRLRTKIKRLKYNLDVNEAIKKLTIFHAETDSKIREIAERCLIGKTDE